jgi:hypothetical protein
MDDLSSQAWIFNENANTFKCRKEIGGYEDKAILAILDYLVRALISV